VDLKTTLLEDFDRNLGSLAKPYQGVLELLGMCKQHGLKTGIVTNGRDQFQRSKIEGLEISQLVDSVVTSGGFGVKKPHHTIFLECLRQLSVSPEQTAFVGDNFQADMEPANALSMVPIWKSSVSSDIVAFSSDSLSEIQGFLFTSPLAEKRIFDKHD
jgi:putative hydrolase of the HAD superfamily